MAHQPGNSPVAPPLDRRRHFLGFLALPLGFVAAFAVANRLLKLIDLHLVDFERPSYWPIGVFEPVLPGLAELAVAAACAAGFLVALRALTRSGFPLAWSIACGCGLCLATNVIHGVDAGLVRPIAGGAPAIQYYHDALRVEDVSRFLADYVTLQPALGDHARTHPPGAVLLFSALHTCLRDPAWIALALALPSLVLLALLLHRLLRELGIGDETARFHAFLLLLLPAVQVYGVACLDVVIAAVFLGAVVLLLRRRAEVGGLAATPFLLAASFLTFAALFLPPVMAACEAVRFRTVRRTLLAVISAGLIYLFTYAMTGFNYVESLRVAARLENPDGWRLLSEPVSWLFTRLECAGEIVLFLGPYLGWMLVRRLGRRGDPARALCLAALATLGAMFFSGAFRLAETARACLFIQPFLLLPIAGDSGRARLSPGGGAALAILVFAQALVMQLFGNYFW